MNVTQPQFARSNLFDSDPIETLVKGKMKKGRAKSRARVSVCVCVCVTYDKRAADLKKWAADKKLLKKYKKNFAKNNKNSETNKKKEPTRKLLVRLQTSPSESYERGGLPQQFLQLY